MHRGYTRKPRHTYRCLQLPTKKKKRLGRGPGSGKGMHTVGRGTKGAGARKSSARPTWYEGGQLPLIKRMPMLRGKSKFNVLKPTAEITLTDLDKMQAEIITLDSLKLEKVIDTQFKKAKIIANGKIARKVTVQGIAVSASAAKMIAAAGGTTVPSVS